MPEFAVALIEGERASLNGKAIQRRVALTVDGEQRLVERVTLDGARSVQQAAGRWAEAYGLDRDAVVCRLQGLGRRVIAENQERKRQVAAGPEHLRRASNVAEEFVRSLQPQWHRDGKKVFFAKTGEEVAISSVYTRGSDAEVDAMAYTTELFNPEKEPTYMACLFLFKEATRMALGRLLPTLPEVNDAEFDPTVVIEDLHGALHSWLLEPRTYRADAGNPITVSSC